jgi:hypothetical protein
MCLRARTSPIAIAVGMAAILVVAAACGSSLPTANQTENPAVGSPIEPTEGTPIASQSSVPTLPTLRAFSLSLDGSLLAGTGNEVLVSSDRGGSWSTARLPKGRSVLDGILTASGAIVVVSTDRVDQDAEAVADVFIDRSADQGATWIEDPIVVGGAAVTVSLDAMADGRIGALLAPTRQGARSSVVSISSDDGATWSAPITFADPPLLGPLGVGSDTLAAVAAVARDIPPRPDGIALSRDEGRTWTIAEIPPPAGFTVADEAAVSRPSSTAERPFRVAVGYASDGRGVVEVVDCRDTSCGVVAVGSGIVEDGALLSVTGDDVFAEVGPVLWHSADGGGTWQSTAVDLGGVVVGLDFRSTAEGWVEVEAPSDTFTIHVTTDAGASWTAVLHHL